MWYYACFLCIKVAFLYKRMAYIQKKHSEIRVSYNWWVSGWKTFPTNQTKKGIPPGNNDILSSLKRYCWRWCSSSPLLGYVSVLEGRQPLLEGLLLFLALRRFHWNVGGADPRWTGQKTVCDADYCGSTVLCIFFFCLKCFVVKCKGKTDSRNGKHFGVGDSL